MVCDFSDWQKRIFLHIDHKIFHLSFLINEIIMHYILKLIKCGKSWRQGENTLRLSLI
jgi:hypothetical protein